jgi:hypothetical protein
MAVPGVVTSQRREVTISRQSIYEESTTQFHTIGTRLRLGDRIFRYAANSTSAALNPGYMTSGPVSTVTTHTNISVTTSASVGQKYVDVTLGAAAATQNQYAGGYIWFNTGGTTIGEGCAYKISSHLAVSASGGTLRVHLYDPLATTLTATTSKATLYRNPWSAVLIHPATGGTILNMPTGVPLTTITQSTTATTYYCWLQTGGFCAIFMGATYTIGGGVGCDDAAGQGLTPTTGVPTMLWGTTCQIGSAAEHPSLVWLYLDM